MMRTPSIFACASAALVLVAGALTQRSASQTAAPNWPQLATELRPAESFAGISDTQVRSIAVFEEAGKVLQHPRCMSFMEPMVDRALSLFGLPQHHHCVAIKFLAGVGHSEPP
jgi:hypothetical protein